MAKRDLTVTITGDARSVKRVAGNGPVVDQIGGINAALRLCPLDCHKNWLRRCNVCDSLENARRLAEMRQP